MNRIGFIEVAVPSMLLLYFGMAYAPYCTFGLVEKSVYPFATFNLYSEMEQDFRRYDVLYDEGMPTERFLLHKNTELHRLERNFYKGELNKVKKALKSYGVVDPLQYPELMEFGSSAKLVELRFDSPNAARDGQFVLHELMTLK